MAKIKKYKFIPFIGFLIDYAKDDWMVLNPFYVVYHIITSIIIVILVLELIELLYIYTY